VWPHWLNALAATVNRFTVCAEIRHFVMAITPHHLSHISREMDGPSPRQQTQERSGCRGPRAIKGTTSHHAPGEGAVSCRCCFNGHVSDWSAPAHDARKPNAAGEQGEASTRVVGSWAHPQEARRQDEAPMARRPVARQRVKSSARPRRGSCEKATAAVQFNLDEVRRNRIPAQPDHGAGDGLTIDNFDRPPVYSISPAAALSDRAARGSISLRKDGLPIRCWGFIVEGSRPSTRARGAAHGLPLSC
jgi:hypothetical protein